MKGDFAARVAAFPCVTFSTEIIFDRSQVVLGSASVPSIIVDRSSGNSRGPSRLGF